MALGDVGDEAFVWVHHHVREDAEVLYGFATRDERVTFEALLGAHGVGPALALAILSVHAPPALVRILADDDVGALCLVPGVGKKTAARLLVELKSRLDVPDGESVPVTVGAGAAAAGATTAARTCARRWPGSATRPTRSAPPPPSSPDDGDAPALLLRTALQRLAARPR